MRAGVVFFSTSFQNDIAPIHRTIPRGLYAAPRPCPPGGNPPASRQRGHRARRPGSRGEHRHLLSGNTLLRGSRHLPPPARLRPLLPGILGQREGGYGNGRRRGPGRGAFPGDHEARGRERGHGPAHDHGLHRPARRFGIAFGRRPRLPFQPKRAGQPDHRPFRPNALLRALHGPRGQGHDQGGL